MSEVQTAISFKLPVDLKKQIDDVIDKNDATLTGLVLDYFRRRIRAEAESEARQPQRPPGEKLAEVTLLLGEGLLAALRQEAARLGISVEEFIYRLCDRVQGERGQAVPVFQPTDYPDLAKLVDCVRQAYLEDRSPVDALLRVHPTLKPAPVPMGQLFAAAIAAVPVEQIIQERVELGLRIWREQGRADR
jgi:hypothetical protein